MSNGKQHYRKSIRLKEYDYTSPNWYYVTICTNDRVCCFGGVKNGKMILNGYGKIVEEEWLKTKEIRKNIDLDYYVVMPNHFHGIIIIESSIVGAIRRIAFEQERAIQRIALSTEDKTTLQAGSLGAIMGQFKSKVTKRIMHEGMPNYKWQRNYYEHIIRNEKDLFFIRKYIELNPLKWELDEYYAIEN